METNIPYFDSSKFSIVAIGSLFAMFSIFGFGLAMIMSTFQCSKTDIWVSVYEGIMWSSFPVIIYAILAVSPYMVSEFSKGVKFLFGWTGYASDQAGYDNLGLSYALILAGLIMTTRMVHTVEVAVCKPDIAELAAFQEDLMKKLKEKEAEKKHDEDLNKPSS
jgi:hypothetical protein